MAPPASHVDIRTVKVSQKGQVSIPTDIRKKMKIRKGDDLVMLVKDSKIVLEKSQDVGLLLDREFKDVRALTEKGLKRLWFNKHEDTWNRFANRRLSEGTIREMERSLDDVRAGRTLSMAEVKRRLKINYHKESRKKPRS